MEHGKLVRAVTRGDGVKGDDVTENVKNHPYHSFELHGDRYPDVFEIRGEIYAVGCFRNTEQGT